MNLLRYADEFVGLLVVLALALFIGTAVEAGLISQWFQRTATLRILLPEQGSAGLSAGADVEVLGTAAGKIRQVIINPDQQMYAEADIEEEAKPFIRRDSVGVIRKRFGVAGAAFVDLSRGHGAPLDWNFAVIQGTTERDPTESIGTLIDQVREKVFPILDNLGRTSQGLADLVDGLKRGKGDIGRLMVDDTLVKDAEHVVETVHDSMARLDPIISDLQQSSDEFVKLSRGLTEGRASAPALLQRVNESLSSLQGVLQQVGTAAKRLPPIAGNIQNGTANLPSLLTQAEQSLHNLDLLMAQMRSSWLLGGGAPPKPAPTRLSPTEVEP